MNSQRTSIASTPSSENTPRNCDSQITASGMKEAIKGFDLTRAADVLIQCGALPARGADGKPTRLTKIDGVTVRVYPISPDYLREVDHGIA